MRSVNWPVLLDGVIRRAYVSPFVWGEHDCALFVADCITAMTGIDPAADFRGTYDCEVTAANTILEYAGGGIAELACKIASDLNYERIAPVFAQRGDVVLCDLANGELALGIIAMNGREALVASQHGLIARARSSITAAWRVE